MEKYIIKRKDVCAGKLIKAFSLKSSKEQTVDNCLKIVTTASSGIVYRSMLFSIGDNGLANDLIFETPESYQIEGIGKIKDVKSNLIIKQHFKLERLLKYLGFAKELTQEDLNNIFSLLIENDEWLKRNMELFGWTKNNLGYVGGGVQTLPYELYRALEAITYDGKAQPDKQEPGYEYIKRKK